MVARVGPAFSNDEPLHASTFAMRHLCNETQRAKNHTVDRKHSKAHTGASWAACVSATARLAQFVSFASGCWSASARTSSTAQQSVPGKNEKARQALKPHLHFAEEQDRRPPRAAPGLSVSQKPGRPQGPSSQDHSTTRSCHHHESHPGKGGPAGPRSVPHTTSPHPAIPAWQPYRGNSPMSHAACRQRAPAAPAAQWAGCSPARCLALGFEDPFKCGLPRLRCRHRARPRSPF